MKAVARILIALAAFFMVGEVALRVHHRLSSGVPFFSVLPGWRPTRFPLSPFLVFGPRVDWQLEGKQQPRNAYFNRQGLRTPEIVGPKEPGEYRIIALGGSTTEDVWNEAGIHWPLVVEQELHAAGHPRVRVLNAAMSAYSTAHSLVQFEFDSVEYEPDLLLVMHNINDLDVMYFAAREGVPIDPDYRVKYTRKSFTGDVDDDDVVFSRLLNAVAVRLAALTTEDRQPLPPYDLQEGLRLFHRNLRSLIVLARSNGTDIVLLTMPIYRSRETFEQMRAQGTYFGPAPDLDQFLADFDAFNEEVRAVGSMEHVEVIDMAARLGEDPRYFADCVHYTTDGVNAFGRILAEELLARSPQFVPDPQ